MCAVLSLAQPLLLAATLSSDRAMPQPCPAPVCPAGAGARRFYLQLPAWGRGGALHAHGSDSLEMDEEQAPVLGRTPATPPPTAWQLVVSAREASFPATAALRSAAPPASQPPTGPVIASLPFSAAAASPPALA